MNGASVASSGVSLNAALPEAQYQTFPELYNRFTEYTVTAPVSLQLSTKQIASIYDTRYFPVSKHYIPTFGLAINLFDVMPKGTVALESKIVQLTNRQFSRCFKHIFCVNIIFGL